MREEIENFVPLPAGWYNYYVALNGQVFRTPCPGLIKIETENPYGESGLHFNVVSNSFEPAELRQGKLVSALYQDCYVETLYDGEDALELIGDSIPPVIRFHVNRKKV